MTYKCPRCGRVHLTEKAAAACCAKQKCPKCNGTGKVVEGILITTTSTCPLCKGSGII